MSASSDLSRAERQLGLFMGICAVVYLVGGIGFVALNDRLLAIFNDLGARFGLAPAALGDRFWLALAGSMMLTIATCSWLVARDPRRHRACAVPVMVSKAVSTAVGLGFFFAGPGVLACLVVATTDFPLLAATWWFHRRAAPTPG